MAHTEKLFLTRELPLEVKKPETAGKELTELLAQLLETGRLLSYTCELWLEVHNTWSDVNRIKSDIRRIATIQKEEPPPQITQFLALDRPKDAVSREEFTRNVHINASAICCYASSISIMYKMFRAADESLLSALSRLEGVCRVLPYDIAQIIQTWNHVCPMLYRLLNEELAQRFMKERQRAAHGKSPEATSKKQDEVRDAARLSPANDTSRSPVTRPLFAVRFKYEENIPDLIIPITHPPKGMCEHDLDALFHAVKNPTGIFSFKATKTRATVTAEIFDNAKLTVEERCLLATLPPDEIKGLAEEAIAVLDRLLPPFNRCSLPQCHPWDTATHNGGDSAKTIHPPGVVPHAQETVSASTSSTTAEHPKTNPARPSPNEPKPIPQYLQDTWILFKGALDQNPNIRNMKPAKIYDWIKNSMDNKPVILPRRDTFSRYLRELRKLGIRKDPENPQNISSCIS